MKYKILGISLILFFVFIVGIILNSFKGLKRELFNPDNIDSILVIESGNKILIQTDQQIIQISQQLSRSEKISPDRVNIIKGFIEFTFYLKNKEIETFRINDNVYHGYIIAAGNYYYKNDSLVDMVHDYNMQLNKANPFFVKKDDYIKAYKTAFMCGCLNKGTNGNFYKFLNENNDLGLFTEGDLISHYKVNEADSLGRIYSQKIKPFTYGDGEGKVPNFSRCFLYALSNEVDSIAKDNYRKSLNSTD